MRGTVLGLAAAMVCAACPRPGPTLPRCSQEQSGVVVNSLQSTISASSSCSTDKDCVLVSLPCGLIGGCNAPAASVRADAEASVLHSFSVTQSESCGACSFSGFFVTSPTNGCGSPGTPAAVCSGGTCAIATVSTDGGNAGIGTFEQACGDSCGSFAYCDVTQALQSCPGWPLSLALQDAGICLSTAASSTGACASDQGCDFGSACVQGSCSQSCQSPATLADCAPGCELFEGNHACPICWCPNGCPDGGSADAGAGDGG
ncbi:MAG: hypothetical protein ACYCWW_11080 [Deltaproteobacteria bacterium]